MTAGVPGAKPAADAELDFSLVRGDFLFRMQRRIGLIPAHGLGVVRRSLLWALLAWLPLAAWATLTNRAFPGVVAEPLLEHFGVHVRCLVAIPLLVVGDAVAQAVLASRIPYFTRSGLVTGPARPRFDQILRDAVRWRDSWWPVVVVAGAVIAWTLAASPRVDVHELTWAGPGPRDLGFGGWWYLRIARPIFLVLCLIWLWRLALTTVLLCRISRLDLALAPSHPDRAGGLGFLAVLPAAFAPLSMATAAVLASHWSHEALYHGVDINTFRHPFLAFMLIVAALQLLPLLAFAPALAACRRRALLDYGVLMGEHGRRVRRRWILGESVPEDGLLTAPELGPVADTLTLYEAVRSMRSAPVTLQTLLLIVVPVALPMLPLVAIQIPIREILHKLLTTLI